jgi:hypothetical protein
MRHLDRRNSFPEVLMARRPTIPTLIPPRPARHHALVPALALLSLGLAFLSPPARASHPVREIPGNLVDVQVLVGNRPTPLFQAPGRHDRRYFEAVKGKNYALSLRNTTGERIGVLITVDGLNVVDGERSSLANHEAMYVLDPWETAEIRGWRTSLEEVRRFVFVDERRSYAERSGKANGDMGWIRVLAFREVGGRWRPETRELGRMQEDERSANEAPPAAGAPSPADGGRARAQSEEGLASKSHGADRDESNPGTGWGRRSRDVVQRTHFRPEAWPADTVVLRYEYASGLAALGIDLRPKRDRLREREEGVFGFAQPPKW